MKITFVHFFCINLKSNLECIIISINRKEILLDLRD